MNQPQAPTLPQTGFLRLNQVLQFIPFKRTAWYDGIKKGIYPAPIKIGRAALYRAEDIAALIERISKGAQQ